MLVVVLLAVDLDQIEGDPRRGVFYLLEEELKLQLKGVVAVLPHAQPVLRQLLALKE